jgi:hypothetical protein
MGFERVAIFGLIDLHLDSTSTGTLTLKTDLPGNDMAVRETAAIPATGRRVLRFRLQGTTKGRLYSVKAAPVNGGVIRLYGARIWARVLPGPGWAWYEIPVPPTSEEWTPVKLPIPPMGDWAAAKLPIPEVGDWSAVKLPIPPTPEEWTPEKLPIKPTPANPEWVSLEIDQ